MTFRDEIKECKICEVIFVPNQYNQLYCSNCKSVAKNKNWNKWYRKFKGYEPKKEIECIICKEKFMRTRKGQKLCSNKECKLEYLRKEGLKRYHKDKDKILERRRNNIEYCIMNKLRMRISCAVKSQGTYKAYKTINLIGCSVKKLKQYLEQQFQEGMNWLNYGKDGWHIDHILPCASFDLTIKENQLKCFHYTNLQPLWARQNLMKSSKVLINEN